MSAAFSVGSIKAQMKFDVADFRKGMREVAVSAGSIKKELQSLGKAAADVGKDLGLIGASMTAFFGTTLKIAADMQEAENLFAVSMRGMADETRAWSETLADSVGLNAASIRELTGSFNVVMGSMGFAEQAAASMSKEFTKLTLDVSSFYNLSHDEALGKLRSGLLGETEPLKQLGIILNQTMVEAFAFSNGIANVGQELSEQQKIVARYGLIMEQTAMAQGDLARTGGSLTNQTRALTDQFKAVAADMGNALIPAMEQVLGRANNVVKGFRDWTEAHKELFAEMTRVAAGTGVVLSGIGALTLGLAAAAKGFAILRASAALSWAVVSGPVGLVVAGIAAVGAGVYTARALWIENWDIIKRHTQEATGSITGWFSDIMDRAKESAAGVLGVFRNAFNYLKETFATGLEFVGIDVSGWASDLRAGADIVGEGVANIGQTVKRGVSGWADDMKTGVKIVGEGAKDVAQTVKSQLKNDFEALPEALQDLWQKMSGAFQAPDFEGYGTLDLAGLLDGVATMDELTAAAKKAASELDRVKQEALDFRLDLFPEESFAKAAARVQELATLFPSIMDGEAVGRAFDDLVADFAAQGVDAVRVLESGLLSLAPAFEDAIRESASRAAMAATEEMMLAKERIADAAHFDSFDRGIQIDLQLSGADVIHEMVAAMEDLKTAGKLTADNMSLLSKKYWADFSKVPLEAVEDIIAGMEGIAPEAANAFRSAAAEGAQFRKAANFMDVAGDIGAISGAVGALGPEFAGAAQAGQVASSAMSIAAKALAGDWVGVALEILNVIGLFKDASKEATKELTGMSKVIEEIHDASDQWLDSLADEFTSFIRNGKADWNSLVDDILDDILKIATRRLILDPIVNMAISAIGYADGGAFDKGHVVDSPEFFNTKSGPAVRGEAGTEVVMPAVRLADGTLGVKSVGNGGSGAATRVTVIDNRTTDQPPVEVRESRGPDGEQVFEMVINAVRRGFIQGDFDTSMALIAPRMR